MTTIKVTKSVRDSLRSLAIDRDNGESIGAIVATLVDKQKSSDGHIRTIENFLRRFKENKVISQDDIDTTIRDILWNVNQIK